MDRPTLRPGAGPRKRWWWIPLAMAVGGVWSCGFRGRAGRPLEPEEAPPRPWVIVPGARVLPDGRPSPALEDRLACALELRRRGLAAKVLVSGNAASPWGDETEAMRTWLLSRGVPEDDVRLDPEGIRTLATLDRAIRVFGIPAALVCSQAYHLPRILYLSRAVGLDATGVVASGHPVPLRDRLREVLAWIRAVIDVSRINGLDRTPEPGPGSSGRRIPSPGSYPTASPGSAFPSAEGPGDGRPG